MSHCNNALLYSSWSLVTEMASLKYSHCTISIRKPRLLSRLFSTFINFSNPSLSSFNSAEEAIKIFIVLRDIGLLYRKTIYYNLFAYHNNENTHYYSISIAVKKDKIQGLFCKKFE